MADNFIIIEGGLVANTPTLPVLNVDILDEDVHDRLWAVDVAELAELAARCGRDDIAERARRALAEA